MLQRVICGGLVLLDSSLSVWTWKSSMLEVFLTWHLVPISFHGHDAKDAHAELWLTKEVGITLPEQMCDGNQ